MAVSGVVRVVSLLVICSVFNIMETVSLPPLSCSIKSPSGRVRENICSISFSMTDCRRELSHLQQQPQPQQDQHSLFSPPPSLSSPPPHPALSSSLPPSPSKQITLRENPLNSVNSVVDLSFTLQEEGLRPTILLISWEVAGKRQKNHRSRSTLSSRYTSKGKGYSRRSRSRRRCMVLDVREGDRGDQVVVTGLPFPHGHYNVTVYLMPGTSTPSSSLNSSSFVSMSSFQFSVSSSSSSLLSSLPMLSSPSLPIKSSPLSPSLLTNSSPSSSLATSSTTSPSPPLVTIAHHTVTLPLSKNGNIYEWNKSLDRNRRVSDTASLVLEDIVDVPRNANMCYKCYNVFMQYHENMALLNFTYTVNGSCDESCSHTNVQLYQDAQITTKEECDACKSISIIEMYPIGRDKNVTRGPITYKNVKKGCYMFEVKSLVSSWPERIGLFWLLPNTTIVDLTTWNATFSLSPSPETRSLWVKWVETPLYNFAAYELQLWYSQNKSFSCRGDKISPVPITVLPVDGKLIVNVLEHKFENLSVGWYCTRLLPLDDRCPRDGCQQRSSPIVELKELQRLPCPRTDNCDGSWPVAVVVGATVAGVAALVALGVALACCVIRCCPTLGGVFSVAYSRVPVKSVKKVMREGQKVLVVWTPCGRHGQYFGPIVAAFKRLLHSYAHCQVYDYLDLLSLPNDQRQQLLAYPIAWLDSLLMRSDVKVIIVATSGARQRQAENLQPTSLLTKPCHTTDTPALDPLLFPYILRRLQDTPDLAADYSRVFHVRFSDVSDSGAELEGIVTWTRYRIPQHFPALAQFLQGAPGGSKIEEPSPEALCDLHNALTSHPDYRPQTTSSSSSPDILTSSRLTVKTICTNCVKDSGPVQNGTAHFNHSNRDSPV